MDYLHDTLIDLLISCMRSGHIPIVVPKIGDWCIEWTSLVVDHDHCIGRLTKILADGEYEITTIGGKVVTWRNAELAKIPDKYMRNKNDAVLFE